MGFQISFERPIDPELVPELEKAAAYASSRIERFRIAADGLSADVECAEGARAEVATKLHKLVAAMASKFRSLGAPEVIARRTRDDERAPIADAFAALESRKWVRSLGRGQVSLAGGALALKRHLDHAVARAAEARFGAAEEEHPSLVDPAVLARAGYLAAFPQSVSLVAHLTEDFDGIEAFRSANAGGASLRVPDAHALTSSDAALRPAICLPVYRGLEGATVAASGVVITTSGRAYRYESRNMRGLERLWEFSMREIVFVGAASDVDARRAPLVDLVSALFSEWDLSFRLVAATDPFFATVRASKALFQRTRSLKYEAVVDIGGGEIAAGSINFAGSVMGDAFQIRTDAGETAHTACVGFGLERLVLALFSQHGFEPDRWPTALREVVFA